MRDVNAKVGEVDAKVDAILARLFEEFRAMRAETAAQTSAFANSITATRQALPQILVLLAPSSSSAPQPPGK